MSIEKSNRNTFEEIQHTDENDQEYWLARELAKALDYSDYRNFITVVSKAKKACKNSGQGLLDHFVDATDMVQIGSGTKRELDDITVISHYPTPILIKV
jgi:DNA-damage-inducible protein D